MQKVLRQRPDADTGKLCGEWCYPASEVDDEIEKIDAHWKLQYEGMLEIINNQRAAVKALVDASVESCCPKCGGAGWVWGYELDEPDNDTATDTMTHYTCDWCRRLRESIAAVEAMTKEA